MWSKGGFNRARRGLSNPTSADNNSGNTAPDLTVSTRTDITSKDLPNIPGQPESSSRTNTPTASNAPGSFPRDFDERRYSAVSPMASPGSSVHDSESSFCVSPIDDSRTPLPHENDSAGDYFGGRPMSADDMDEPSSPPSPQRPKKKMVAFAVGNPAEIPSFQPVYSPIDEVPTPTDSFREPLSPESPVFFRDPKHEDAEYERQRFNRTPPPPRGPKQQKPAQAQGTRWDTYSGEPTLAKAGKSGQVDPQNASFHKSSGSASNFLNWGKEHLQSGKLAQAARTRIANFSKNDAPQAPQLRDTEPWLREGATRARRKSASRGGQHEKRHERHVIPSGAGKRRPSQTGFVPTTVTTITGGSSDYLPQKPAPTKTRDAPRVDQLGLRPEPKLDTTIDTMRLESSVHFGDTTPKPTTPSPALRNPYESPSDSPQDSPPAPDSSGDDKHLEDETIMSRRRPIPSSMPTSRKPVRKPTPAEASQDTNATEQPPADTPKDPLTRVQMMEIKRNELQRRRIGLETVIKELGRVIQPTSIADIAAKKEVKRTVASMENEIAEIKREEHDLGMKISRAWRRLDENSNGDGSNLWIKRVTS